MPNIETIFINVIIPFTNQHNTGNIYEIVVVFLLLRKMVLTNDMLHSQNELLEALYNTNYKKRAEIKQIIMDIQHKPVGSELQFDNHTIVNIRNVTQDDSQGTTGDFILITDTGQELRLSVQEGIQKRDGRIKKCLTNPTIDRFRPRGLNKDNINQIHNDAIEMYKQEMTLKYGNNESIWARKTSQAAIDACTKIASIVSEHIPSEYYKDIVEDLLHISNDETPADYLAMVNKKTYSCKFYRFAECIITEWDPIIRANSIYLDIYANQSQRIGRVQIKFNNGIWHNGKTSSLINSWNAVFNLTDVFRMQSILV